MLKNVLSVLSAVSALAFAGGVLYSAVRSESPLRRIPWWWWIGNGAALLLLGYANGIGVLQGSLLLAGGFSLGIGATLFVVGVKAGQIRWRSREGPSEWDHAATTDWYAGAELVLVRDVVPDFSSLRDVAPYVELHVSLLNQSLHMPWLQTEVRGRIQVPDENGTFKELTHNPTIAEVIERNTHRPFPEDGLGIARNGELTLVLRQHLLPAVRDVLVAGAVQPLQFNCERLDVGVVFRRWLDDGQEEIKERERIPMGTYQFTIPSVPS
jgi:hypothetical protein